LQANKVRARTLRSKKKKRDDNMDVITRDGTVTLEEFSSLMKVLGQPERRVLQIVFAPISRIDTGFFSRNTGFFSKP
jgi:hypothetical protein